MSVKVVASCGSSCDDFVEKWYKWVTEDYPNGSTVETAGVTLHAPAVLSVTDHDEYFHLIGDKSRNMVRKAIRSGYDVYRPFIYNRYLDDVYEINTSKAVRSGGPMRARYHERLEPVSVIPTCKHHRYLWFGAFKENKLMAYVIGPVWHELFVVNTILGHGDALPDGVMNGLFNGLVLYLNRNTSVREVVYLTFNNNEGLARFKRSVGFVERDLTIEVI